MRLIVSMIFFRMPSRNQFQRAVMKPTIEPIAFVAHLMKLPSTAAIAVSLPKRVENPAEAHEMSAPVPPLMAPPMNERSPERFNIYLRQNRVPDVLRRGLVGRKHDLKGTMHADTESHQESGLRLAVSVEARLLRNLDSGYSIVGVAIFVCH